MKLGSSIPIIFLLAKKKKKKSNEVILKGSDNNNSIKNIVGQLIYWDEFKG